MSNELLESALKYRNKYGFSVIPLLQNKRPAIKWEEFQKRKATDAEIKNWFMDGTPDNLMIGIVTGAISNLTVLDMDSEEAKISLDGILPEGCSCPVVKTPRGYHYYFKYKIGLRNRARILDGVDIRSEGGYVVVPPSVNDAGGKYFWQWRFGEVTLIDVPESILTLQVSANIEIANADDMFTQGRRDEDLFHVANILVKGGMDINKISSVMETLAMHCVPPFPSSEVNHKIKSAVERALRRERNLTEEVRHWIMSSSGAFLSSDVARCLQLSSRDDLKNLSQILNRLKDSGLIEKAGTRAGMFRRIEKDYTVMNWKDAIVQPLDINYPLGIHNICNTYAKNVIVIAGIKDSGKTSFCLDFIKRNQDKFNIHYFTNEMGKEELKLRLMMHEDMGIDDWKFNAYEIGGAWEDIVQPNDITILDYIEVNNEFYQIGEIIKKMHEKLDKGIVLLGLQKASGARFGRGAEFSIQRPRLYITLDSGIATILSAKNRKPELNVNPVGWICEYEIQDGWKIIPKTKWHQEN